ILIGVLQKDMKLMDALKTYTLLTVGDGLVSQIPSILIALTAGIIVTRVSSDDKTRHLGKDISEQIFDQPKSFILASGVLGLIGMIPGMPKGPIWFLGTLLGMIYF